MTGPGVANAREVLTAPRTYYVSTTGSDSNNGLTAGTAFATHVKAINTACALDLSTFSVTISTADGTYNVTGTAMPLKSYVGAGPITIQGNNASPQNVIINTTNGDCAAASGVIGQWNISGFTLNANTFGYCGLRAYGGSTVVQAGNIRWGKALSHVFADYGAIVFLIGTQEVYDDFNQHYQFTNQGIIQDIGKSVTITGTRTFGYFAYGETSGELVVNGTTYSSVAGSAFSTKFNNATNALIVGTGGNVNLFPGTLAGASWAGGYN